MTALDALRHLVRILTEIGGYMTHEDQQALAEAKRIVEAADGMELETR